MARGPRTRSKVQPDRIQARHFHLTFAALYPGELTFAIIRDAAAEWAGERGKLLEYSTGREKHKEPADPERDEHFHVYVHYDVKIDVKNWRKTTIFDLEGQDQRVLHPEVQKVGGTPGDRHRVIKYGMKYGDYDQDLLEPLEEDEPEKEDKESWAKELNEATSVRAGMKMLMESHAEIYYSMGARIEPMLAARLGDTSEKLFEITDFNMEKLELDQPIVLHGVSGAGKTEFAVAHFQKPHIVRRRDDLKKISFNCDGLVFDDMDFSDWKPEEVIALLNWTKERSISARYSDAQIPAMIGMIFTTNCGMTGAFDTIFPAGRTAEQQAAIARRLKCVPVAGPLMVGGRAFTSVEMQARRNACVSPELS